MKQILLIAIMQFFVLSIGATDKNNIIFKGETMGDDGLEYLMPISGDINNNNLNLEYKGGDVASVSVKDKNGSIVYQNSINGKNTINLGGYAQGDYTVKVEDTKGNSAVAKFQVTK